MIRLSDLAAELCMEPVALLAKVRALGIPYGTEEVKIPVYFLPD